MSSPHRPGFAARLGAATALAPLWGGPALACPMCFGAAPPRVLDAYLLSAALLSLLPLAILAALGGWLFALSKRGSD